MAYVPTTLTHKVEGKALVMRRLSDVIPNAESAILRSFKKSAVSVTRSMRVKGKKPTYPIQWDSEKQKRAFFATRGFGGGIPHKRRGDYIAAWKWKEIRGGYSAFNLKRYAGFIAGDFKKKGQSRIHKGRWPLVGRVVEAMLKILPKQTQDEIKAALSRT